MNSYASSHQDLASDRRKKMEYRSILQQQIKQKQKSKQGESRFKTEPLDKDRARWDYSTKFETLDSSGVASAKTKRFSEHSVFLPSIEINRQRREANTSRLNYVSQIPRHKRTQSYGIEQASIYAEDNDNDIEAIQAIAQCEVIIQNLRRLRMASLSSMKRKMKNKSIDIYSPRNLNANAYHQKQSSATRSKQSSAEQEVQMFHAYEPRDNSKKQKERQRQRQKSKKGQKLTQKDKLKRDSIKLKQKIQKVINQFNQQLDESQQAGDQFKEFSKIAGSSINIKQNNENEIQQNEESMKRNQQNSKNKNRQKILLKFLGNAKLRGAQLQEKIARRRSKFNLNEQSKKSKAFEINESKDFGESRIENNSKISIKSLSQQSEKQSEKISNNRYQNNQQDQR